MSGYNDNIEKALNAALDAYNIAYNSCISPLKEFRLKKAVNDDICATGNKVDTIYTLVEIFHNGYDRETPCFDASPSTMVYMLRSMTNNVYEYFI